MGGATQNHNKFRTLRYSLWLLSVKNLYRFELQTQNRPAPSAYSTLHYRFHTLMASEEMGADFISSLNSSSQLEERVKAGSKSGVRVGGRADSLISWSSVVVFTSGSLLPLKQATFDPIIF
eukprot:TRINITY_DN4263_c0_g1_i18.p1 TRINITY_DN4263_c0_g1~~TRINITY_DN4263_c0_g1_i18.p1  ORF type:complete len:121 (+),score=1.59 TRINITY_DN4263_c0_g1_i18:358-720(+)